MPDKVRAERPGYYAIIPADVRYDEELRPNAKLLYGEITALTNSQGFCYATNQYFADLYGFTRKTVSMLISSLEKRGYIHVEIIKTRKGEVEQRRIWVARTVVVVPGGIPQKKDTPPSNKGGGIPQKFQGNNTSNNNTPITPKGDTQYDAHFTKFWDAYPRKVDKQRAYKAFKKIKPNDELLQTMLVALSKHAKSSQWLEEGGKYIPHASTWLNGKRWEDELPTTKQSSNTSTASRLPGGVEQW